MLRKTIKNIALLDLQNFTAEALREIKKIESCAMLLVRKMRVMNGKMPMPR